MIKDLIIILVLGVLVDLPYLTTFGNLFTDVIKKNQGTDVKLKYFPTFMVYVFITISIYFLIIKENRSLFQAFILGSTTYGIFEFTNMALFKHWPLKIALLDTVWGGILFTLVTFTFRFIQKKNYFNLI